MINTQEEYERALSKYELLKDANRTDKGQEEFLSLAKAINDWEDKQLDLPKDVWDYDDKLGFIDGKEDIDYLGKTITD